MQLFSKELNFVSTFANKWHVERSRFTDGEWDKFQESLKKLEQFREVKSFMENLSNFHWELRSLYLENSREITTPNAWSRRDVRIIHKTKLYTI